MFLVGAWEPAAVRHTKTRQGMVDWIPNVRQSHWREFKHRCDKIQFELSTNQESIQSIFFFLSPCQMMGRRRIPILTYIA